MYHAGDHVVLADMPRPFVCRVVAVETFHVGAGRSQMLKLAPLHGPWPADTILVRLDDSVEPTRGQTGGAAWAAFARPDARNAA